MTVPSRRDVGRWLGAAMIAAAAACSDEPSLDALPDFERGSLEPSVQKRVAAAEAALEQVVAGESSRTALGEAYGELAMTLHAQDLITPAETAYANARALLPDDKRWPYLLGHLYADSGRLAEAIAAFEDALERDPDYAPASVYLGQLYLQRGDTESARALFEKVRPRADARAAALTGLGKVALSERRYAEAVAHFEAVLRTVPQASRLNQPLAMAYRALGEEEKAKRSLERYSAQGLEPAVPDPVVDVMAEKVAVSSVLMRRGQRAGKAGRFDLAERAFREVVEADPDNAEAVANLGISLANLGRIEEARKWLTRAVELDGTQASVQLNLGLVLDRLGRDAAAGARYRAVLRQDPGNLSALVYLADERMRSGFAAEAAQLYARALELSPDSGRVTLSLAMAYVRLKRHADARDLLEQAVDAHPQDPDLVNALARLLATAAADSVRDGERALSISKALFERTRSPYVGQTYAMAMAETGRFDEAVALQRETIIAYQRMGDDGMQPFLRRNLRRYEAREPARDGWPADDPNFLPRSPAARLVTPDG